MISFEQVTKRYGQRLALDSVTWRMDEGECIVVLGPSGAGKTTLLRLLTHEIQPTSGTVTVGTFRSGRLSRAQRALLRRTLGIIYEDFRLLGDRTVFENVALAVRITGRFTDDDVVPRVERALDEVGLRAMQSAYPSELSAGEKQRAAIARAIANRPAVVIADEPTGALERRSAGEVLALLRRIHEEGAALLMVTTRQEVADAMRGRVLHLVEGRLPEDAAAGPASGPPVETSAPIAAATAAETSSPAPAAAPAGDERDLRDLGEAPAAPGPAGS
jgi:cell division transport system ATP-binding protein